MLIHKPPHYQPRTVAVQYPRARTTLAWHAGLSFFLILILTTNLPAQPTPPTISPTAPPTLPPASSPASPVAPPVAPPHDNTALPVLPHLTIDPQRQFVDLEATVVLRQADWLELVACSPKSREHESILTIEAKPSHIHLALVLIGLQPGQPWHWQPNPDANSQPDQPAGTVIPPTGPRIAVTVITPHSPHPPPTSPTHTAPHTPTANTAATSQPAATPAHPTDANQPIEIPINQWVKHQPTDKLLPDNIWLFVGSTFINTKDQTIYAADMTGSILSLVNFGDDVLTRDTATTNDNDNAQWGAMTQAIPPIGTRVTLRLRPVLENAEAPAVHIPPAQKLDDNEPATTP